MATFVGFCMEFFRILLTFTRPYSDKILDIFYRIVMGGTKPLPPITDKILLLSATELAQRIRKRKLKAETIMTAYIQRVQVVQPLINACTDQRFVDAMNEAKAVDILLSKTDKSEDQLEKETPLLGVPFTCKESVGVESLSMTKGAVKHKDEKASRDAETVRLLRRAGAIPVTVTNVPVFCMWWESANHVFGLTKNPYDNTRTVGGSTGGEGALLTAAGAVFGIGTDLAGSIRIPASFCGVYGHKPSRGVISNDMPGPQIKAFKTCFDLYVSTGPMCRYAQDLTLLTEIMAGDMAKRINLHQKVDFHKVKIYYMEELPGYLFKATPDIKSAVRKAVRHFEDTFNVQAIKLEVEELKYAFEMWECKLLESGVLSFKDLLSGFQQFSLGKEFIKSLFQMSEFTWPALYFAAIDRRNKDRFYYKCLQRFEVLKEKMEAIFKDDAILLLPSHPEPPPHYLLTIPKYPNIGYTCIFSTLGYASTQIPAGLNNGLPIGIQAVSSIYKDNLTIAAAIELDKVFNGWISPCPIIT